LKKLVHAQTDLQRKLANLELTEPRTMFQQQTPGTAYLS
jgi:hypothetical protein